MEAFYFKEQRMKNIEVVGIKRTTISAPYDPTVICYNDNISLDNLF